MWRGDRRRPSPQPFRNVLLILLLVPGAVAADPVSQLTDEQRAQVDAVLEQAASLKDAGACSQAMPSYQTVIDQSEPWDGPAFWVHSVARYDMATCHEALGQPDGARAEYDAIVALHPRLPPGLLADALFRRALLDVIPGTPTRSARRDLARVRRLQKDAVPRALVDLQLARLDSLDGQKGPAIRRLLRAGRALQEAGDDAERDRRGAPLDWYRAEASLVRATLWANEAARITLSLTPSRTVVDRIEARADALSQAEAHYAVAAGMPFTWATRALLDLGAAWLQTSDALLTLLDEATAQREARPEDAGVAALVTWLEPRVAAQFRKAAESWQLCVESSRVLTKGTDTADQCQAQLDALLARPDLRPEGAR